MFGGMTHLTPHSKLKYPVVYSGILSFAEFFKLKDFWYMK